MSATQTNLGSGNADTFSSSDAQTIVVSEAIVENSAGIVKSMCAARRVSDGATKVFDLEAGFKRDGSADVEVFNPSILNARGTVADLLALATVTATIDADGDTLRVRVIGLNGQAIDWSANITGVTVNHE